MKSLFIMLSLCVAAALPAQKTVKGKVKLTLQVPATGGGTNGAGVAWNPDKQLYYTAFAGNAGFPLTVFNAKGKLVDASLSTGFDVRGFWFNTATGKLEGTAYSYDSDSKKELIYSKTIGSTGIPSENTDSRKLAAFDESFDQNLGVFNPKANELLFRSGSSVFRFDAGTGNYIGKTELQLSVSWDDITGYALVYTGRAGEEYGVYDHVTDRIYLFDAATGKNTKIVALPKKAADPGNFNFSYANGMFWIFDSGSRKWSGYSHP